MLSEKIFNKKNKNNRRPLNLTVLIISRSFSTLLLNAQTVSLCLFVLHDWKMYVWDVFTQRSYSRKIMFLFIANQPFAFKINSQCYTSLLSSHLILHLNELK